MAELAAVFARWAAGWRAGAAVTMGAALALLLVLAVAPLGAGIAHAQATTSNLSAPAATAAQPTPANATGPAAAAASAPATGTTAPAAAPTAPWKTDTGDTAWMLTSTALVLLMTIPGLALFYGGMVRRKNVIATVAQSFAICCVVTVAWFVVGYSLAFGTATGAANNWIGGFGRVMLAGITMDRDYKIAGASQTIPEYVYMMYQMTFAIITPALICGAFAERFKFSALLLFTVLSSVFVYSPIAHWVWGGGFLGSSGVLDFAGGTVVHINAGVAGLVCALVLGPRKGFGHDNMAPNNLVYTMIGASLLWVGWFGFNAGSAVGANALAGVAMANTQIATAVAALAWMAVEWFHREKPGMLGLASGAVAGLVAVTPAAGFVTPTGALVIGLAAGVGCYAGAVWLKQALKYDDSLDAFGVHGIGGLIGALLTGVFADAAINPAGKVHSIITQAKGCLWTIVWTAVGTLAILYICKYTVGLRVSDEGEVEGLDAAVHGEALHEF